RPAMGAPVTPETCDGRPSRGRFVLCLKTPGSPHRWDDRSPGAVWSPAPMEFPGGAAPREPPFVGVSAGSGPPTRGPYAAARQRPRGRSDGITCVRTGSEGLQWGQLDGRRRSFWIHLHTLRPSGGSWARRGQPRLRGGRLARAPIRY
ncbi:hypothetical protein KXX28_007134, partial [Aspergillus fumigatus]